MTAQGMVLVMASAGLAAMVLPLGPALADDATPFDGDWKAQVVCPASSTGQGYDWRLPVHISAGTLSGTYHSPSTDAEGEISGWVRADGKALVAEVPDPLGDLFCRWRRVRGRRRYRCEAQCDNDPRPLQDR